MTFSYARSEQKLKTLARNAKGKANYGAPRDSGFGPVDAGPLRIARYIEPFALLIGELAYGGAGGPELAYRFERFGQRD